MIQLLPPQIEEVGVGGVFALLMLREVLRFIKDRNGTQAQKPFEFWQAELRKTQLEINQLTIIPLLDAQTKILDEIKQNTSETVKALIQIASK